jgi:hypothetical protein
MLLVLLAAACARRPAPRPVPPASPPPQQVATAVSDVATGGSWEEGGRSGVHRVIVRSAGRRDLRSEVELQWLVWSPGADQPAPVRGVPVAELSRGGIVVTNSRIEEDDGKAVVRLGIANAVTGVTGEARIWPTAVGMYRVRVKWAPQE